MRTPIVAAASLLLLAACGASTDADTDSGTDAGTTTDLPALTVTGGCGDALFYAGAPGGSHVVTVHAPDAWASGSTGPTEIDLPAAGVDATLSVGRALRSCDDVQSSETRTDAEHAATRGHVTITIEFPPEPVGEQAFVPATVVLDDVVFADGTRVDHLAWDAEIGWYPG